jgi:hypothetical protein
MTWLFSRADRSDKQRWLPTNANCSGLPTSRKGENLALGQRLVISQLTTYSQLLAEFDLPPSGLGKLANSIPLPLVPNADTDPRLAQYQFFFLALIAIRKLLNRVLLYLYSRGESPPGQPTETC